AQRRERGLPALTYGLTGGDWQAADVRPDGRGGMAFTVRQGGAEVARASLRLPGVHNVQNALAVIAVAVQLGVPPEEAAAALAGFSGVGRRFEVRGEAGGVTVIDDYAHHPTAIRATLAAARTRYGKRPLWAVWQPHTYSRTKALLDEFALSFGDADHVIITDIYRSRDRQTFGVGPGDVLDRMPAHPDARHIGPLDAVVEYLAAHVQPGDIVIVMSAGDATRVGDELLERLGGSR
ncbi:MAG TPA: UDP-N-acetylmuramate--L-alanine ligase, partial [Chloroflexi bacterium]|nr:UDP-N-acetylmuramate--L-alanine ligase [Chloroflexota bacterium]